MRVAALKDVCRITNGGTPKSGVAELWHGGVPWLTPAEMGKRKTPEIHETARTISQAGLANSSAKLIPTNSVILSTRAPIGHLAVNQVPMAFNQGCRGLTPGDKLDTRFLYYFLYFSREALDGLGTGTTFKELSSSSLANFQIPLPPLDEQRRIVAVLDKAFAAIATATANAQKNQSNARALFESYLQWVFSTEDIVPLEPVQNRREPARPTAVQRDAAGTKTGGRAATTRAIQGRRSLGVGPQTSQHRAGWHWWKLDEIAQLESGHTPSRRFPQYWGGDVPWLSIKDAKRCHGEQIESTFENTNEIGIANSSARILPAGTVCLSRTASVGYVTILGCPMATSQDFINWICSNQITPEFLKYLFMAQGDDIFRFSSGAVHQTIYYPEAKAFHVCLPSVEKQLEISAFARELRKKCAQLEGRYNAKLTALAELKQSLLQKAFAGALTTAVADELAEAAE